MKQENSRITQGLAWKLLERFGVQGVQFVLQIILARLLDPEHYGVLSMMVIFTTLANVFIQNGFNTSLVQNKTVKEEDYSSVFWISLSIAAVLYMLLFFAAPGIAAFYEMTDMVKPFRVLCLMLFPGAYNSVQLAKVSREMDFKKVFYSNIVGVAISGIAGIIVALLGGGLWALVVQTLMNVTVACMVMSFTVKWYPKLVCNFGRVKVLFSFGWKLLVSSMLDTLYQDVRSLVIGKKYSADTLGYHDRGKQFPQFLINGVNGAVQSVMLPAMSAEQDRKENVKAMMRNAIMLSSYIIFPMMAGLAGVARPVVQLLLTDKWLECVPYLQIYCFSLAFYPVHTSNLQAINAMGRSDIYLKLELIKKGIGFCVLLIAVFCFQSPIAIAMSGVATTFISCFINAAPNKKLINYSYLEQMRDIIPSFSISAVMCIAVLLVGMIDISPILLLLVQVLVGITVYVVISAMFKLEPYRILLKMIKDMFAERK